MQRHEYAERQEGYEDSNCAHWNAPRAPFWQPWSGAVVERFLPEEDPVPKRHRPKRIIDEDHYINRGRVKRLAAASMVDTRVCRKSHR